MASTNGFYNVQDTQYAGGAKGDGKTDDTAAIQAAINAACAAVNAESASVGGLVFFPTGTYVTSAPLVVQNPSGGSPGGVQGPGVVLYGGGPFANDGGAGSGTGTFTPGTAGGVTSTFDGGATIQPSSSWAAGSAATPAAILFDGHTNGAIAMCEAYRLRVDGGNAGTTAMAGFAIYGAASACSIRGCSVVRLYSANSTGIDVLASGSSAPDGTTLESCLLQFIGGVGVSGLFGDATISRVHTQQTGKAGFEISGNSGTAGQGGNVRLTDCRGDLSATSSGFHVQVPCGAYLGMVQLNNCSTQRNNEYGFHVEANSNNKFCPVYLSNCVAQGDGIQSGNSAGYRFDGPVLASLANCAVHVNTTDVAAGAPSYAIITDNDAIAAPVGLIVQGGFFNAASATWAQLLSAPQMSVVDTLVYAGGPWSQSRVPTHATSL